MDLGRIQQALRNSNLDGWLFYDHHNRDPLALRILGLPLDGHITRRWFYLIPAHGTPHKLVHRIESGKLDILPGERNEYSSWQELESCLEHMLAGVKTLAMQYSPRNAIMYVSMVDAGTIELLRTMGKKIESSADLVSQFEAVLTDRQIETHMEAGRRVDVILAGAWLEMGRRVRDSGTNEYDMIHYLQQEFTKSELIWEHGPNVSAGPNSADSHYEPTLASSRPIVFGDFVLIDLWAKLANFPDSIYYDVTWTGVVGREPTEREHLIFTTVRNARDAAIVAVEKAYAADRPIPGWMADDSAREYIRLAGFGEAFTHRTGHNIAAELHGSGAHLDNLETHDERLLLPNTCFSIEPGLYFPGEFGIRSEVNMITRPGKAIVSGQIQRELVRI